MNKYEHIVDNIEELMSAIAVQAAKDYIAAYKAKDKSKITALEHFFHSDFFFDITYDSVNPDALLKELRRQANDPTIELHQKKERGCTKE